MKTLVFSDVHLKVSPDGRAAMQAFIGFLQTIDASAVDRIIILGDLFDFWFEYRHVIFSGYFDVLRALAHLRDRGVQIHFVCGNHDLWAGRFLRDHLGFQICAAPLYLRFGAKTVLFVHGDGLNPRDTSYRVYKRIASSRPVTALFRLLHPDWAMAIAQWVSRNSRRLLEVEDLSRGPEVEPVRAFARATIRGGDADVVVWGHCRDPLYEVYPGPRGNGLYINTGDWLYHQSYVEWDGFEFRLLTYKSLPERNEVPGAKTGQTVQNREEEPEQTSPMPPEE